MGEDDYFVVVDAFHGFGGDHGVDDGFFGGLDGGEEERIQGIVGEHGELVEQGRHADLLKQNGLYARLYHRQFETADQLATPA